MTHLVYPLNEHVIEAAHWRLTEELAAYIDAVNTGVNDGTAIEQIPASRIFDYVPRLTEIVQYPAVGILELPGEWVQDVGDTATATHPFAVVLYVQNPDQQQLNRQLRRGRQAIVSCLMQSRDLPHPSGNVQLGAWGLTFSGYRPGRTLGPAEGADPENYTSWTSMGFIAQAEDNPV